MNTYILITTRDYYSLDSSHFDLHEVKEQSLLEFSSMIRSICSIPIVSNSPTRNVARLLKKKKEDESNPDRQNPLEVIRQMFIEGASSEDKKKYHGFWDTWDYKLYLKHLTVESEVNDNASKTSFEIYVAPCFPTKFKDNNLEIRHKYLKTIFGEFLTPASILLAHDLDLFLYNDERFLKEDDCKEANYILTTENVSYFNVFGFQHVDDPHTVYSDIIKKLDCLTAKICHDIINRLINEGKNQILYKQIDEYPFISSSKSKEDLESLIQQII